VANTASTVIEDSHANQRAAQVHKKLLMIAGLLPLLFAAGCQQEGPAERAGTSLDNAAQNASDALNPPQGPAQSVGRKVDRALGD
jgi:hypothetical protein